MSRDQKREMEAAKIVLWVDLGSGGWAPQAFKSEAEALAELMDGGVIGPCILMRPVKVELKDD